MSINKPIITSTLRAAGAPAVILATSVDETAPESPVTAALSKVAFYSFDLQQTYTAPLNRAAPEFNITRFS